MILCDQLQWGAAGCPLTPPLDLELPKGSLTAVIGSNGCGKSSFLKVIAGLQRPLSGRISVSAPRFGGIGYLVQQQAIDRQFPIDLRELVSAGFWGQRLDAGQRRQRLEQVLFEWQLDGLEARPLQALSGGELQRALLARASLMQASLLLLDEADAALDDTGQTLFWRHIHDWVRTGRTLVVVSHDLGRVRQEIGQCLVIDRLGCRYGPSGSLIGEAAYCQVA
ncbi:metal ABC transporter ATP-binding protein [Stutzerimonas azotifigens]|uniref:metal ABC transporter ATP-binding protein n=1 Tax=Stutzerimonas azotifigens TaxID=291995 RepID=UPI0004872990|nr:ATP-binding cassette domain-containing protein [Stutzerimonas azotifigens]